MASAVARFWLLLDGWGRGSVSLLVIGLALSIWIVLMLLMVYRLQGDIVIFGWSMLSMIPIVRHLVVPILGLVFLPFVALHELSHAVLRFLAGFKIRRISLFPEFVEGGIRLGYVESEPPGDQIFVGYIAAAPLVLGSVVILGFLRYVFDVPWIVLLSRHERLLTTFADVLDAIFANGNLVTYYLFFMLANGAMPGSTDWAKVLRGLIGTFAILALVTVILVVVGGDVLLSRDNWDWWLSALSLLAIAFTLVAVMDAVVWLIMLPVGSLAKRAWIRKMVEQMGEDEE